MNEIEWYRVTFSIELKAISKEHAVESAIQQLHTKADRKKYYKKTQKIRRNNLGEQGK